MSGRCCTTAAFVGGTIDALDFRCCQRRHAGRRVGCTLTTSAPDWGGFTAAPVRPIATWRKVRPAVAVRSEGDDADLAELDVAAVAAPARREGEAGVGVSSAVACRAVTLGVPLPLSPACCAGQLTP